ncbi:hypothetical protein GUJ93_ZPchr0002g24539 [Zizania palustris]|uniref:Uncharacterized protein n=1 Tax=Zizania palustris TaxID=103762 RepID=A0A8J5S8V4_ZIZPA|nr:hypothetical protein GUJ93_ZPchr0002g24539 [Zizania palustris]
MVAVAPDHPPVYRRSSGASVATVPYRSFEAQVAAVHRRSSHSDLSTLRLSPCCHVPDAILCPNKNAPHSTPSCIPRPTAVPVTIAPYRPIALARHTWDGRAHRPPAYVSPASGLWPLAAAIHLYARHQPRRLAAVD